MKKTMIALAAAFALSIAAVPAFAFAAVPSDPPLREFPAAQERFGLLSTAAHVVGQVAERTAASPACARFADADGDGICDVREGAAQGARSNGHADADGDGVCDRYAEGAGPRAGCDQGRGCRQGGGWGYRNGPCR